MWRKRERERERERGWDKDGREWIGAGETRGIAKKKVIRNLVN